MDELQTSSASKYASHTHTQASGPEKGLTFSLRLSVCLSPTHSAFFPPHFSFFSHYLRCGCRFSHFSFHLPVIFFLQYLLPGFQPLHLHSAPSSTTASRSCLHLSLLTVYSLHLSSSSSSSSTPVISKSHSSRLAMSRWGEDTEG